MPIRTYLAKPSDALHNALASQANAQEDFRKSLYSKANQDTHQKQPPTGGNTLQTEFPRPAHCLPRNKSKIYRNFPNTRATSLAYRAQTQHVPHPLTAPSQDHGFEIGCGTTHADSVGCSASLRELLQFAATVSLETWKAWRPTSRTSRLDPPGLYPAVPRGTCWTAVHHTQACVVAKIGAQ